MKRILVLITLIIFMASLIVLADTHTVVTYGKIAGKTQELVAIDRLTQFLPDIFEKSGIPSVDMTFDALCLAQYAGEEFTPVTDDGKSEVYHASLNEAFEAYKREIASYGRYGLLEIPSVGISVPVNCGGGHDEYYWCDIANSAFIMDLGNGRIIGDHVNQEFGTLGNVSVGDTVYIKCADGVHTYTVYRKETGHNTGEDLVTDSGFGLESSGEEYGFCLYTCRGGWTNVWMVFIR